MVDGSRERETRALMVAVFGIILKVQDFQQGVSLTMRGAGREGRIHLLISKLNQAGLVLYNLVSFVLAIVEQLWEREPLPRHLVSIIRIHELIVVHTIGCIAPHLLDGRFAAVKVDNVINESLTLFGEGEGFGRVWSIVFGRVCLPGFIVLSRSRSGDGGGFYLAI